MNKNQSLIKWISILISFDIITKIAFYLLGFFYVLNPIGFGGDYDRIFQGHNFVGPILFLASLGSISVYLLLSREKLNKMVRLLVSIISFPLLVISLVWGAKFFIGTQPESTTSILISRIILTIIVFIFLLRAKFKYFKFSWSLIFSACFGNTLSLFYPPYKIIDFIYFPAVYGKAFNFADLYFYSGCFLLFGSLLYYVFSKIFLIKRQAT